MQAYLTEKHQQELQTAKQLLENPGLAAKLTHLLGSPLEKGFAMLPARWNEKIGHVTQTALLKSSEAAIFTMADHPHKNTSKQWHKLGVTATGAIGGFFGFAAIAIELPISTTIIMRSIADIARSEGESVCDDETKLACLEVFALGGPSKADDATESGYFAVRATLAQSITKASEYIAEKGLVEEGAPALMRLIIMIAKRFSIQVSEKLAAQAIPVIGAASGATINILFINHFQAMAQGHFIIRRLERIYGKETIREAYKTCPLQNSSISIRN